MPSEATNAATREEWRELGFYYDLDEPSRRWRLVGSREGLVGFAHLLDDYVANPVNATLSEHEHYGPYMYLEVMTAEAAGIDDHSIHGTLNDLARLATVIRERLDGAADGDSLDIGAAFTDRPAYELRLEVRPDGFDPASADPQLAPS